MVSTHPSEIALSVHEICKIYKTKTSKVKALNSISLTLHKGEFIVIMGTSGSGKSTLLNMIGALDHPDEGSIKVNGNYSSDMFIEPHATTYRSDNIGFIFQDFQLLKDFTVEENIAIPLILKNKHSEHIQTSVNQMITMVGLDKWRSHRPHQLSGGQQQRVAIARALINEPPILLADEPTGNLDYNSSVDIMDVLVRIKDQRMQSILLVTHDPYIATFADRVLFFHDGTIVDEHVCNTTKTDLDTILHKFKQIMGSTL